MDNIAINPSFSLVFNGKKTVGKDRIRDAVYACRHRYWRQNSGIHSLERCFTRLHIEVRYLKAFPCIKALPAVWCRTTKRYGVIHKACQVLNRSSAIGYDRVGINIIPVLYEWVISLFTCLCGIGRKVESHAINSKQRK